MVWVDSNITYTCHKDTVQRNLDLLTAHSKHMKRVATSRPPAAPSNCPLPRPSNHGHKVLPARTRDGVV